MKHSISSLFYLVSVLVAGSLCAEQKAPLAITSVGSTSGLTSSVSITLAGGTAPYTVKLMGNFVKPAVMKNIYGNKDQKTFTFTNIPATPPGAQYEILVVDAAQMRQSAAMSVGSASDTVVIGLASFVHPTSSTTADGSIEIAAFGRQPLTYAINGKLNTPETSNIFSGLSAGVDYSISVIPVGATINDKVSVATAEITLAAPTALTVQASIAQNPDRNGGLGTINSVVTGGFPPYTVTLTGATLSAPQTLAGEISNFTFTDVPVGKADGGATFTIEVTDSVGNKAAQKTVSMKQPQHQLKIDSITTVPTRSSTRSDGTLTVNLANRLPGSPVLQYLLSGPNTRVETSTENSFTFKGLSTGSYTVTVLAQGSANISATGTAEIIAASPIVISTQTTNQDIINNTLGSIIATITGGTPPYVSVTLNPGNQVQQGTLTQSQFTFANLVANTYTITVVDSAMVTATATVTINCVRGPSTNAITNFITLLCNGGCTNF